MLDNRTIQFLHYLYSVIKSSYRVHLQSTAHTHSHHRSAVFKHFKAYTENCLPSERMNAGFRRNASYDNKILFSLHSWKTFSKTCVRFHKAPMERNDEASKILSAKKFSGFMMTTDLREWLRIRNFSMLLR